MDFRARTRRFGMGMATLVGHRQGFFAPYRYAGTVVPPGGYPELAKRFDAAKRDISAVLDEIDEYGPRLATFAGPPPEPRWDQSWFPRLDAAAAYAFVRRARPKRIVEVGSGHSTRFLARAAKDAAVGTEITCIDPAPRAAIDGLKVEIERRVLEEADIARFAMLDPGDIAFFDSSHLLWPGTDVDMILNRILPVLRSGVLIHLHDIFLPDPYPEAWAWRGYTEQAGLGGWIASRGCRIVFASRYALTRLAAAERPGLADIPIVDGAWETSLWLERR